MKNLVLFLILAVTSVTAAAQPLIRFTEIDPYLEKIFETTTGEKIKGLTINLTEKKGHPLSRLEAIRAVVIHQGTGTDSIVQSGMFETFLKDSAKSVVANGLRGDVILTDSSNVTLQAVGIHNSTRIQTKKTVPWSIGFGTYNTYSGTGGVTQTRGIYSGLTYNSAATFSTGVANHSAVSLYGGGRINELYGYYSSFRNYNGTVDFVHLFDADFHNYAGGHTRKAFGAFIGGWHNEGGVVDSTAAIYIDNSVGLGTWNRALFSESTSLSELYGNLQLTPLAGTGNRIATVSPTGLFMATKKDSTYYWNLAYSWGNHAAQGYIDDGNTDWDNIYGFITDGNIGWDNSYGFITDGNTGWDNSYGFITDGNSGWDNSYGFITKRPPIAANYLVGTANDSLTNEIVVGTTPGGILGGTWSSPTIDNYSITQPMLDTYIEGTPDQGKWLGYSTYGMDWLNLPTANASGTLGIATFNANDFNSTDGEISIDYANATKANFMVPGFLSASDWSAFNDKIGGSGSAGAVAIFDAATTITNDADFTFNPSTNALTVGSGNGNGTVTSGNFVQSSDFRLKTNIKPLAKHEWADAVEFKSFTMKSDKTSRTRYGVIAQELEKINPDLIHTNTKGYKSVAYIDLLVAKAARQDEIIRNLIQRINKLEDENEKN